MMLSPVLLSAAGKNADLSVPFNDLSFQWRQIEAKAFPDIRRLFEQSTFCLGPFVERFEQAISDYLGIPHAIGVNSVHLPCILP